MLAHHIDVLMYTFYGDEKIWKFKLINGRRRVYLKDRNDPRRFSSNNNRASSASSVKLMTFGGVHLNFASPLIWLEGLMDSFAYAQMLEQYIFQAGGCIQNALNSGVKVCFMQDGAGGHTANAVLDYLSGMPFPVMGRGMTNVN